MYIYIYVRMYVCIYYVYINIMHHVIYVDIIPGAPTRPARDMSAFWIRQTSFFSESLSSGSGRSARRSGRAGSGKIGCQQNYSPRKQKSIVVSKASKTRRFNVSREARISEILCKPTKEQNQWLTTGLSAVYHRDELRALFLAAGQWNGAFLSLRRFLSWGFLLSLSVCGKTSNDADSPREHE